jgi:hypothetical protein
MAASSFKSDLPRIDVRAMAILSFLQQLQRLQERSRLRIEYEERRGAFPIALLCRRWRIRVMPSVAALWQSCFCAKGEDEGVKSPPVPTRDSYDMLVRHARGGCANGRAVVRCEHAVTGA